MPLVDPWSRSRPSGDGSRSAARTRPLARGLIELLSPSNKAEPGFSVYAKKRQELIRQPVHLVEIDFLLGGLRPPMGGPLPRGDYYAFVSRADCRPDCDVYAWSIRHPIPTIPLPLDPPDPDLPLGLATLYAMGTRTASTIARPATTAPSPCPWPPTTWPGPRRRPAGWPVDSRWEALGVDYRDGAESGGLTDGEAVPGDRPVRGGPGPLARLPYELPRRLPRRPCSGPCRGITTRGSRSG